MSAPNGTNPSHQARVNRGVPGVNGYFPLTEPKIGSTDFPKDLIKKEHIPKLFTPIKIRNAEFKNRIFVSPMCQYSAVDGVLTDWHLVHLGGFAVRGAAAVMVEATAVVPEGRISPEDSGIWDVKHIEPLKRIVNFIHSQGALAGIQLAHAGRKASTYAPWVHQDIKGNYRNGDPSSVATAEEGGWPDNVVGPSDIAFDPHYPKPRALKTEEIKDLQKKWVEAVERAKAAGFDYIELHFAHGYLAHEFLSPLANNRTDEYGGSLENRARFALEIAAASRKAWGEDKPLFVRLSATDWAEQGEKDAQGNWISWGIEQTRWLVDELIKVSGADLIDTSSGGLWAAQKIAIGPGYQVPFAEAIKKDNHTVGAVGLITSPQQAEEILTSGRADVIFLARELLRRPDWPLHAAQELGVVVQPPVQYERAFTRMIAGRKD